MPDRVPMHYDFAGNLDRWGSKNENLVLPLLTILMALVWTILISYYKKKSEKADDEKESVSLKSTVKVFDIVGVAQIILFTIMQGFLLYGEYTEVITSATRQAVDIGKIVCILMGVFFIILGNYMTKTRINSIVGFRNKWSMYNDTTWKKSNYFGAIGIMIEGVIAIVAAILMKNSFNAVMLVLGVGVVILISGSIYSYKVYKAEIQ